MGSESLGIARPVIDVIECPFHGVAALRLTWRDAVRADTVFFLEIMDYRNVGMIQRGENSRNAVVVVAEAVGKELDGNTAAQPRVGGLISVSYRPIPGGPRSRSVRTWCQSCCNEYLRLDSIK